jgi:hypothetical protein
MTFPFDGNCIHPRTKKKKGGVEFCLACHENIIEEVLLGGKTRYAPKNPKPGTRTFREINR